MFGPFTAFYPHFTSLQIIFKSCGGTHKVDTFCRYWAKHGESVVWCLSRWLSVPTLWSCCSCWVQRPWAARGPAPWALLRWPASWCAEARQALLRPAAPHLRTPKWEQSPWHSRQTAVSWMQTQQRVNPQKCYPPFNWLSSIWMRYLYRLDYILVTLSLFFFVVFFNPFSHPFYLFVICPIFCGGLKRQNQT